ncbi:MAG: hypothetical protein COT90_05355 [Candidatus Diapherotrites archaeon CG10_big_fil_rev_8_21_14_0_10_31_34]|nr:MAG: hypothetical protein COT90_05355 [Candidatus Diapherotrites archaeon CG10_big_fil_rev_8_21_14_0_10_31_34]
MTGVIDSFSFVLKKSFDFRLWLYLFLIMLLSVIGFIALVFAGVFIGAILFVFFQLTLIGFLIYFLLFLIFFFLMLLVGSAINGTSLNLVKNYLEKGKIDLGLAFDKTKPRIFTSFKVELIVAVFFGIVFLLCFFPLIFSVLNLIESISLASLAFSSPEQIFSIVFSVIGSLFLGIILFSIFNLVISPFTIIYKQIPFFESHSAVDSIKRAIFLGKKNYLSNLAFFVLMFVFIGLITLIYLLLTFSLTGVSSGQIVWLVIFAILLRIVIEIFYTLWISVFSFVFDTKIYLVNVETEKKTTKSITKKQPIKKIPVKKTNSAFKKAKPKDFL